MRPDNVVKTTNNRRENQKLKEVLQPDKVESNLLTREKIIHFRVKRFF